MTSLVGCDGSRGEGPRPLGSGGASEVGVRGTSAHPTGGMAVSPASTPTPLHTAGVIGDGSSRDSGPHQHQPRARRLAPGEEPPQFVVLSWDGAGETGAQLFSRFRGVAQELQGAMTFFLSGIYTLPEAKRMAYAPPQHPVGSSAIGFLSERSVHATIAQLGLAWQEGHEIGTHFNGHFCGPGGVRRWSPADWDREIDQAVGFVSNWRTNTGFTDLPPLPFDYAHELIGGRTPCLEGQANLLRATRVRGWRYDSSGTGTQVWPSRFATGLWNIPMQQIPFPGHRFEVLAMDYNMMYNQSRTPNGDPGMRPIWLREARDAFLAGFQRAYTTNRAPLIIGNHFEHWNGGIYMEAIAQAATRMAQYPSVRLVSFRQLIDWLEAQDPKVLRRLQSLPVGRPLAGGWASFLRAS
ncbi:hypothetical protein GA0070613_4033 [Micromonospora inositola]|uniref:Polysaccharide deacetylase n=1 Tax=Micromonospora inositola TaxID=47865 RepID=A0A1C5J5V5_9ACTN|nr:hypothetical protein GA0070613_4033 [Micromonospora inositola]